MQTEWWRQRIAQERARLQRSVDALNESGLLMSQGDAYGEMSLYDNHPADAGSETFEREKDLGLRLSNEARLRKLDHALMRLERGDFNVCEVCGGPIGEERLAALPEANLCICCQTEMEELPDRFERPAEELVLNPPFGRSHPDNAGYDGEDAWQDVAVYGTSETPQDVPGATDYQDLYRSEENLGVVQAVEALVDQDGEPILREDEDDDNPLQQAVRDEP